MYSSLKKGGKSYNNAEKDFLALEKDLCQLHEMLKENNYTPKEIQEFLRPLRFMAYKGYFYRYLRIFLFLLLIFIIGYYLVKVDFISWQLSAVGRIVMIKILPYWNWQKMAGTKCLINGYQEINEIKQFDCQLCESIDEISVEENIDPEILSDIYLDINVPVLISDGGKNWPPFSIQNLTDKILKNNILSTSYPCDVATNIQSTTLDVSDLLTRSKKFKKYFLHFRNCELNAMKAFRTFTPRPYFLKPEISPIQYSWILISQNYSFPKHKIINLSEKVTVVGQIDGSTHIRVIPRKNCYELCPTIEITLNKGEFIVFGTLWDFEYKPLKNSNNIAVILEA